LNLYKEITNLVRAFGGAIIFSLPLLMTMEMWWHGFYMDNFRLILLTIMSIPLLAATSHYSGFETTSGLIDDLRDAFIALAIGAITSLIILTLLSQITLDSNLDTIVGKILPQSVAAAIGASLARSQLGSGNKKKSSERSISYFGEVTIMLIGALFLAFNLAPTEEMILLAFLISEWQAIGLGLLTIGLMHAFIYAADFMGQESVPESVPMSHVFLKFTVAGYAVAFVTSLIILWIFERTVGMSAHLIIMSAIVLSFPAGIGAAAARLVL
jgi:putative integral membrane protein (TIGR02587 family)